MGKKIVTNWVIGNSVNLVTKAKVNARVLWVMAWVFHVLETVG